jgi:hypothetical protein
MSKDDKLVSACILPADRFEAVRQQIHGVTYLCGWDVLYCLVAFEPPVRMEDLKEVLKGIEHENRSRPA